jgi:hypothetical protein
MVSLKSTISMPDIPATGRNNLIPYVLMAGLLPFAAIFVTLFFSIMRYFLWTGRNLYEQNETNTYMLLKTNINIVGDKDQLCFQEKLENLVYWYYNR